MRFPRTGASLSTTKPDDAHPGTVLLLAVLGATMIRSLKMADTENEVEAVVRHRAEPDVAVQLQTRERCVSPHNSPEDAL